MVKTVLAEEWLVLEIFIGYSYIYMEFMKMSARNMRLSPLHHLPIIYLSYSPHEQQKSPPELTAVHIFLLTFGSHRPLYKDFMRKSRWVPQDI